MMFQEHHVYKSCPVYQNMMYQTVFFVCLFLYIRASCHIFRHPTLDSDVLGTSRLVYPNTIYQTVFVGCLFSQIQGSCSILRHSTLSIVGAHSTVMFLEHHVCTGSSLSSTRCAEECTTELLYYTLIPCFSVYLYVQSLPVSTHNPCPSLPFNPYPSLPPIPTHTSKN